MTKERSAGVPFVERHLFIGKKQNRTKEGEENSVVLFAFLVKSPCQSILSRAKIKKA